MAFKTAAAAAGLTASNSNVTFGSVTVGKTANAYVKLVNQGSEAVTISNLQISGQNFSSSAQDSLPITVGAEASLNLGVQFTPSTSGTSSGQLTVMNTSSTEPLSLTLNGTGTSATSGAFSGLTCASSSMTGSATDACTVTLGSATSSDTTINLTSDNSAVTLPTTVTIPAGASNAGFTANVSAVSAVQTVTLTAAAAGISQIFTLQLGAVVPNLDVSSLDITFGDVNVDDSSSRSLTLISTENAPVTIDSISLSGQDYSVAGLTSPMTLNPNQTATLSVQFSPKSSGTSVGQLTLNTNSTTTSSKMIKLTGNAVPQVKQLSCANASITSGTTTDCAVTLNSAAATGGLAIALVSSTNAVAVPTSVMVPAGATSAPFTATTSTVTTSQTATLTASTGSSAKNFNLQLNVSVPTLTLSAASVAFGNVPVNSPATQTLTLSSTGSAAVTVSAVAVTGSGFAVTGAAFPQTLNPGQSATLTVMFNPTAAGVASGQLTLSSDSSTGTSSVVSLSGAGVPVLSGLSCAAGSITGAGTDSCTVTLNTAAATGGFLVNLASNNSAVTVPVPASVTVPAGAFSAGFTATISTVTSAQTAILTASAGSAVQTFTLQLGTSVPTLAISSSSLDFGNISVNASATQTLTLSSTGSAAVTVSAAAVTGSGFTVSGAAFPLTLNPGQTATLAVQFNPTVAGAAAGQVALTSNSSTGTSSVVSLSGTGIPVLSGLSCATGSFAGVGTDACTVTLNAAAATGGLMVNLASNNSAVTIPISVTIPAGASSVGFTATVSTVTTTQTATLTASASGVSKTFALQLNANVATLSLNTLSIAFGSVNLNTGATQSVNLTSTGTTAVTISAISVTGTGFTVSGVTLPLTLNPSQTATLNVVFDPTTAGAASGQVTITSNSSTGNTAVISLSGTGQSVTYEIDLSWLAPVSSPDPVAGYIVFRANTGTSSYQQVNATTLAQTAFVDNTVQSGQSYNYMVESVDASGAASVPSNIASAVIP